jgi:hypothetical protein
MGSASIRLHVTSSRRSRADRPEKASGPENVAVIGREPNQFAVRPANWTAWAGFWFNATRNPYVLVRRRPFRAGRLQRGCFDPIALGWYVDDRAIRNGALPMRCVKLGLNRPDTQPTRQQGGTRRSAGSGDGFPLAGASG